MFLIYTMSNKRVNSKGTENIKQYRRSSNDQGLSFY